MAAALLLGSLTAQEDFEVFPQDQPATGDLHRLQTAVLDFVIDCGAPEPGNGYGFVDPIGELLNANDGLAFPARFMFKLKNHRHNLLVLRWFPSMRMNGIESGKLD
jgi:hypothetical protein